MKKITGAVALAMVSAVAHADHEVEPYWVYAGVEFSSAAAHCQYQADVRQEDWPSTYSHTSSVEEIGVDTYTCTIERLYESTVDKTFVFQSNPQYRVKEHDEPVTCEAVQGNTQTYQFSYYFDGTPPNMAGLSCVNGCQADVLINTTTEYSNYGDGFEPSVEHYNVTQTMTGAECGGEPGDPPTTPPGVAEKEEENNCTADYYTSPVTGSIVCGKPPTTTTDANGTETTVETAEDGTKTTTTTTPDGTTTETTKYPDGSTTTTTTTAGGETNTEYTNEPKDDEEPDECPSNQYVLVSGNLQCKSDDPDGEGSVSGGSCDAEPSCDGDPILCAILQQAWSARCNAELPAESEILVETGLDGFGVDTLNDGEIGIAETFDSTGFLTEGTCPVPLTANVGSITLEFSLEPMCTLAGYISPFVILSGLLAGARIVVGAI